MKVRPWASIVNSAEFRSLIPEEQDQIAEEWLKVVGQEIGDPDAVNKLRAKQQEILSAIRPSIGKNPILEGARKVIDTMHGGFDEEPVLPQKPPKPQSVQLPEAAAELPPGQVTFPVESGAAEIPFAPPRVEPTETQPPPQPVPSPEVSVVAPPSPSPTFPVEGGAVELPYQKPIEPTPKQRDEDQNKGFLTVGTDVPDDIQQVIFRRLQEEHGAVKPELFKEKLQEWSWFQKDPLQKVMSIVGHALSGGSISTLRLVGKAVQDKDADAMDALIRETLPPESAPISRMAAEGFGSAVQSIETVAPIALTLGGAGLGMATAVKLAAGAMAGLYALSGYRDIISQAEEEGKDTEDINIQAAAVVNGLTQGGLQYLGDILSLKFLGWIPKGITAKMGATLVPEAKSFAEKLVGWMANYLKNVGKVSLAEIPEEAFQNAAEELLKDYAGLSHISPFKAALSAVGPTFFSSLIFGALGRTAKPHVESEVKEVVEEAKQEWSGAPQDRPDAPETMEALERDLISVLKSNRLDKDAKAREIMGKINLLHQAQSLTGDVPEVQTQPKVVDTEELFSKDNVDLNTIFVPSQPTPSHPTAGSDFLSRKLWQDIFPGAKVTRTGMYGKDVKVTLPNGLEFRVRYPVNLKIYPDKYREIWGIDPPSTHIPIGAWLRSGKLVSLSKLARPWTPYHEAYHIMQDFVLTRDEYIKQIEYYAGKKFSQLTLLEHKNAREASARAFAQWKYGQLTEPPHSFFQKIADTARRLLRALSGEFREEDIFHRVSQPRAFRKPIQKTWRLYQPRYQYEMELIYDPKTAPPTLKSQADVDALIDRTVKLMKTFPKEWFYWHEDNGRVIRTLATDNQVREMLIRAQSIGKPDSQISANLATAMTDVYRSLSGDREGAKVKEIIEADAFNKKLAHIDDKAESFYTNTKAATWQVPDDAVAIDTNIKKYLGYGDAKLTPAQYEWASDFVRAVAERLNVELGTNYLPRMIQSALWSHSTLAKSTPKVGEEISDVFPGSSLIQQIPPENRVQKFNELAQTIAPDGNNKVLETLGFQGPTFIHNMGTWDKTFSPNVLSSISVGKPTDVTQKLSPSGARLKALREAPLVAMANAWVTHQDAVAYYQLLRPSDVKKIKGKKSLFKGSIVDGYVIAKEGEEINVKQFNDFMKAVQKIIPDVNAVLDHGSIVILDVDGTVNKHINKLNDAITKLGDKIQFSKESFAYEHINTMEGSLYEGQTIREYLKNRLTPEEFAMLDDLRSSFANKLEEIGEEYSIDVTGADKEEEINDAEFRGEEFNDSEKYAGSLNLPRFSPDMDLVQVAKALYHANSDEIDKHRRVGLNFGKISLLASRLGISKEDIERMQAGSVLNPEEMFALIQFNKWAVRETAKAAEAMARDPSEENKAKYAAAYAASLEIMKAYQGAASEWGRVGYVLSQAQKIIEGEPAANAKEQKNRLKFLNKTIERLGGEKILGEKADLLRRAAADPDVTLEDLAKMARDMAPVKTSGVLHAIYVNLLLSGLKTHAVNATGNALILLGGIPTKTVAGTLDALVSAATGRERQIYAREGWEYAVGVLNGFTDACQIAWKSLRSGESYWGRNKLELRGRPLAKISKIIPLPTDFMVAVDDFFKTLVFSGQAHALMYRHLKKTGELIRYEDVISKTKGEEIYNLSLKEATYRTLQETSKLADWLSDEPTGTLKWINPFKLALINIIKMAGEHTPIEGAKLMMGESIRGVPLTEAERMEQYAKSAIGSVILAVGLLMVTRGLITGSGPSDDKERQSLYLAGWRPFTIKTPWGLFDYSRIEPLATLFGVICDVWDTIQYAERDDVELSKVILRALDSISVNIANKTMFTGIARAMQAMVHPDRYGSKWWEGFISSLVPNLVAGYTRAEDPTLRQPKSVLEAVRARLPGDKSDIMPVYDRWGNTVKPTAATTWLQRLISPAPIYDYQARSELDELLLSRGIHIGRFGTFLTHRGVKVQLTPDEVEVMARGRRMAYDYLNAMIEYLERLDDDQLERVVRSVLDKFDTYSRRVLLTYPRVMDTILTGGKGKK